MRTDERTPIHNLLRLPDSRPGQPHGLWSYAVPPLTERLLPPLLRRIGASWRLQWVGLRRLRSIASENNWILTSYHEALLMNMYAVRDTGMVAIVSPSWEGEIIAVTMRGLGFDLARGSSGHQSTAAVRETVRILKRERTIGWVVDGPEGPRRVIKPGVLQIASLSGRTILPIHSVAFNCWRLPTWDRQAIPVPFSRIAVGFGEPVRVPKKLRGSELQPYSDQLAHSYGTLEKELWHTLASSP